MDGVKQFVDIDTLGDTVQTDMPTTFVQGLMEAIRDSLFTPPLIFQGGKLINPEVLIALRSIKYGADSNLHIKNVATMGAQWFVAFTELPTAAPWVGPLQPWTITDAPATVPPYTTSPNTTVPWKIRIKYRGSGVFPYDAYTTFSGTASVVPPDDPVPTQ